MSRHAERRIEIELIQAQARLDVASGKNIRQHRYQHANIQHYETEFRLETERLKTREERQEKATKICSLVSVETVEDLKRWIAEYLL